MNRLSLGIIGCGDFLRFITNDIQKSKKTEVRYLFDLDFNKSKKFSELLGGTPVPSADEILDNKDVDIVCIFVPPQYRRDYLLKAVKNKKPILTTKPLGSTTEECEEMVEAVEKNNIKCGLIYWRSSSPSLIRMRDILDSGEIGNLTLYREDWIHHYPSWNNWALSHNDNGGPFMDAMIHSLNLARHLMKSKATNCIFFSDNYAQKLPVNDTEFMKIDFKHGGSAYMFISWAPDLEVYNNEGNFREMFNVEYFVTDKKYKVTIENRNGKEKIIATRDGIEKIYEITEGEIYFDSFAEFLKVGGELPSCLASVREGYEDVKIIRDAEKNANKVISISY